MSIDLILVACKNDTKIQSVCKTLCDYGVEPEKQTETDFFVELQDGSTLTLSQSEDGELGVVINRPNDCDYPLFYQLMKTHHFSWFLLKPRRFSLPILKMNKIFPKNISIWANRFSSQTPKNCVNIWKMLDRTA